jgi:hypothetical protein
MRYAAWAWGDPSRASVWRLAGVLRPVPRWSSSRTRYSSVARRIQPLRAGGRGDLPPWELGVGAGAGDDLAGVDRDRWAARRAMVERHLEGVVCQPQAGDLVGG